MEVDDGGGSIDIDRSGSVDDDAAGPAEDDEEGSNEKDGAGSEDIDGSRCVDDGGVDSAEETDGKEDLITEGSGDSSNEGCGCESVPEIEGEGDAVVDMSFTEGEGEAEGGIVSVTSDVTLSIGSDAFWIVACAAISSCSCAARPCTLIKNREPSLLLHAFLVRRVWTNTSH